jgi:hypothetical protein
MVKAAVQMVAESAAQGIAAAGQESRMVMVQWWRGIRNSDV